MFSKAEEIGLAYCFHKIVSHPLCLVEVSELFTYLIQNIKHSRQRKLFAALHNLVFLKIKTPKLRNNISRPFDV